MTYTPIIEGLEDLQIFAKHPEKMTNEVYDQLKLFIEYHAISIRANSKEVINEIRENSNYTTHFIISYGLHLFQEKMKANKKEMDMSFFQYTQYIYQAKKVLDFYRKARDGKR